MCNIAQNINFLAFANASANTIEDWQNKLLDLSDAATAIEAQADADGRALSESEGAEIDRINSEFTAAEMELRRRASVADIRHRLNSPSPFQGAAPRTDGIPIIPAGADPRTSLAAAPKVSRRAGVLLPSNCRNASSLLFDNRPDAWGRSPEAFFHAIANRLTDPRLIANATGTEGIGADGGFSVPAIWFSGLIDQALSQAELASRCRIFPAISNSLLLPMPDYSDRTSSLAGLSGNWANEASTATAQKLKWRTTELRLNKIFILAEASSELVEDGLGYGDQLSQALSVAASYSLDAAILRGTGTGQPLGIVNAPSAIQVAAESGQAAETLLFENIVNLYARLAPDCQRRATWFISPSLIPQLLRMTFPTSGGMTVPVLLGNANTNSTNSLSGEPIGTILGRPVVVSELCAQPGSVGDICLADLSQYALLIRNMARIETDIGPGFARDVQSWRLVLRITGTPLWNQAIVPYGGGQSLSWAAYLAERS